MRRSFTGGYSAPKPLQSVIRVGSGHSHTSRHMRRLLSGFAVLAALLFAVSTPSAAQQRIALVIGNAAYQSGPLATSLADGGLVAEALTSIGFEIVEGADVNQNDM